MRYILFWLDKYDQEIKLNEFSSLLALLDWVKVWRKNQGPLSISDDRFRIYFHGDVPGSRVYLGDLGWAKVESIRELSAARDVILRALSSASPRGGAIGGRTGDARRR